METVKRKSTPLFLENSLNWSFNFPLSLFSSDSDWFCMSGPTDYARVDDYSQIFQEWQKTVWNSIMFSKVQYCTGIFSDETAFDYEHELFKLAIFWSNKTKSD